MTSTTLRLGTRGSLLARRQSDWVAEQLRQRHPQLHIESIIIKTTGDRITDRPLSEAGGKGLFVKEIEQALLDRAIDLAVHSFKDVPVTMPLVEQAGLRIIASPLREDPRDVLICRDNETISELPIGATVATGSLRRRCQLLAMREDLSIVPVRGNIDTRIEKLKAGHFDAMVLAAAGVKRAGLFDGQWMHAIPAAEMLPAPGQGALAIQCRADDAATIQLLAAMDDPATSACVVAERAIVQGLNGDCHSPIAALAEISGDLLNLRAAVGAADGNLPVISASAKNSTQKWRQTVQAVLESLNGQGAAALLHGK